MTLLVCNLVFFQGLETFDYLKLTNDRVRGGGGGAPKTLKWGGGGEGGGGGAELQNFKCRTGGECRTFDFN